MKAKKLISDYLPDKREPRLVQAKIDPEVWERVNEQRRKDKITWHDLVEAFCKAYLDEKQKS